MDSDLSSQASLAETFPVEAFPKPQRRVLGVLIEKAYTTPEGYPLTLKAATNACNQKSNRSPITNYSEDQVEDTLEELRSLGLVAVVNTAGGRTERYRHLVRKVVRLSEPQIAILGELLMRGSQQMGELRSRASRMVSIDSQDELREELTDLLQRGLVKTSGPLARRGIDVDHNLYESHEPTSFAAVAISNVEPTAASQPPQQVGESRSEISASAASSRPVSSPPASATPLGSEVSAVVSLASASEIEQLREEQTELRQDVTRLQSRVSELEAHIEELRRELGIG